MAGENKENKFHFQGFIFWLAWRSCDACERAPKFAEKENNAHKFQWFFKIISMVFWTELFSFADIFLFLVAVQCTLYTHCHMLHFCTKEKLKKKDLNGTQL